MLIILDVDKTLLKTNISFLFGKELRRRRVFSFAQVCRAVVGYALYYLHCISQEQLHRSLFQSLFWGISKKKLQDIFCLFFAERKEALVRKELLSSLSFHPHATIILVSSSPDWIVEEVGKAFSIPITKGSEYQTDSNGCFCNIGKIMTGLNKAIFAKEEAEKIGETLAVYTDSSDDIPLLEIADLPVAVYPDRELFRYAQKKGWHIIGR